MLLRLPSCKDGTRARLLPIPLLRGKSFSPKFSLVHLEIASPYIRRNFSRIHANWIWYSLWCHKFIQFEMNFCLTACGRLSKWQQWRPGKTLTENACDSRKKFDCYKSRRISWEKSSNFFFIIHENEKEKKPDKQATRVVKSFFVFLFSPRHCLLIFINECHNFSPHTFSPLLLLWWCE